VARQIMKYFFMAGRKTNTTYNQLILMLLQTKIFHFEMAHAINGYPGACKNIHGHSYKLYVTVSAVDTENEYLPAPGFALDFKALKKWVQSTVIETFDHKLVLSREFLAGNPAFQLQENLVTWDVEPTAENMLIYIQRSLHKNLPPEVRLVELKLNETADSYASWINTGSTNG
jgi:6-pyruvoyltetrahydropterin/6-carboxytetrahydropterin synthase